jgi:hypothetical protein
MPARGEVLRPARLQHPSAAHARLLQHHRLRPHRLLLDHHLRLSHTRDLQLDHLARPDAGRAGDLHVLAVDLYHERHARAHPLRDGHADALHLLLLLDRLVHRLRLDGLRHDGLRLDGLRHDGLRLDGLCLDGLRLDRLRLYGLRLDGLRLDRLRLDRLRLNGLRHRGHCLRLHGGGRRVGDNCLRVHDVLGATTQVLLETFLVHRHRGAGQVRSVGHVGSEPAAAHIRRGRKRAPN